MSDEDALLNAIAAHPDEDTPRLMYADRLETLNLRFTHIGQAGQSALLNRFGGRVDLF